jgi:transcriptional regulator with XRE-family HTH domain
MTETWAEYVKRVTAGLSQKDIAVVTGIDQTGISRWLRGQGTPRAESVVAFARALGRLPLEALVTAGYIEEGDVDGVIEVVPPPSNMSTAELRAEIERLMDELMRRIESAEDASTVGSKTKPRQLVEQSVGLPGSTARRPWFADGPPHRSQ